jgi:hypothetical protein
VTTSLDKPSALRRSHLARVDARDPDRADRVAPWVERLAWGLDESIPLPAGKRMGVDGVIGFVPFVGDLAGMVLGMVVVLAGAAADVSLPTVVRMLWNTTLAGVVGVIPFAGDLFDIAYKANTRNIRLINADLADRDATRKRSLLVLASIVGVAVLSVLLVAALIVWMVAAFVGLF